MFPYGNHYLQKGPGWSKAEILTERWEHPGDLKKTQILAYPWLPHI